MTPYNMYISAKNWKLIQKARGKVLTLKNDRFFRRNNKLRVFLKELIGDVIVCSIVGALMILILMFLRTKGLY